MISKDSEDWMIQPFSGTSSLPTPTSTAALEMISTLIVPVGQICCINSQLELKVQAASSLQAAAALSNYVSFL